MIPLAINEWAQFILATISLTIYGTAYTIVVVPYMAMVPVMTDDYDERTQITGLRANLSAVGTILGGAAALLLSSFSDEVFGLRVIAISFGSFTLLSLLIASRSTKGLEDSAGTDAAIVAPGVAPYLALLKERNLLILLMLKFLGAMGTGILTAALPYFAEHILGDEGNSTIGLAIYVGVSATAIPLWNKLSHRFDKRRLLLAGNSLAAVILLSIGLLAGEDNTIAFFLGCALLGLATSAYLLIPYSLVPDLVDFYEYKTKERHESVFFGLWITVHQMGIAFAGLVLGFFLGTAGYRGDLAVQTGSALLAVRLAFGLIPGLFLTAAALVLQKYQITREVYQEARAALEQKSSQTRAVIQPGR
jgi:GPH family glycoside/pentoside/hexuronide:cation symporter